MADAIWLLFLFLSAKIGVGRPGGASSRTFQKAIAYEDKASFEATAMTGRQYTWSGGETLIHLIERKEEILERHQKALTREIDKRRSAALVDVLADVLDDEDDTLPCQVCNL